MKKILATALLLCCASISAWAQPDYVPTAENLQSRQEFSEAKFGIFLHWGIYSMFAQGEWYLQNSDIDRYEYAKAADGFYPHRFDAKEWVSAFKAAGAKYICITSRHHDGFSMWDTKQSDFNIMKATPFHRDVIRELADECHRQGLRLHLYYSHVDWIRDDYPMGRSGLNTGKDPKGGDYDHYLKFMNAQLTELLTQYGNIGAIWFDGVWDHDQDATPFDWRLREQYDLIHSLQPACLVGNNHHLSVNPGEDMQIFERDVPGENKAGYSGEASISRLPLETCQTMNGAWGYKVGDQEYKSTKEIIHLLVKTSGKGANLLLNIGPQPNGTLPSTALERLKEIGEWTQCYGETIYGTMAGDVAPQPWGVTTRKGNKLYVHVLDHPKGELLLPIEDKVLSAVHFIDNAKINVQRTRQGVVLTLPESKEIDNVITLTLKEI